MHVNSGSRHHPSPALLHRTQSQANIMKRSQPHSCSTSGHHVYRPREHTKNPRTTTTLEIAAHIEGNPAGFTTGQATLLFSLTIAPPRALPCTWSRSYGTRQSVLRSPPMLNLKTLPVSHPTALSLAGRLPACNTGGLKPARATGSCSLQPACRSAAGTTSTSRSTTPSPPNSVVNRSSNLGVASHGLLGNTLPCATAGSLPPPGTGSSNSRGHCLKITTNKFRTQACAYKNHPQQQP